MNKVLFSYLDSRLKSAFESSGWEDSVGKSFQDGELQNMLQSMKGMDILEQDIEEFVKKAEILIKEQT